MKGIFNKVMLSIVVGLILGGSFINATPDMSTSQLLKELVFRAGNKAMMGVLPIVEAADLDFTPRQVSWTESVVSRSFNGVSKSFISAGKYIKSTGDALASGVKTVEKGYATTTSFADAYVMQPGKVCLDATVRGSKWYGSVFKSNPYLTAAATAVALGLGYATYKYAIPYVTYKARKGVANGIYAVGSYIDPDKNVPLVNKEDATVQTETLEQDSGKCVVIA